MKSIIATQLLIAAAAVSATSAGDSTAVAANASGPPQVSEKQALRYDGKSFEHWRDVLETELNVDRQTEALQALGAFAANGHSKEAAKAIAAFMNQQGRLPVDETAHAKVVNVAAQAIARADEADVMALVPDSAQLAGYPTSDFWRKTQAHFQTYSKSYKVAEFIQPANEKPDARGDLSRFVADLKPHFPPRTWHEDGGKCDIAPFETNQSVVVSAPASMHSLMDKVLADMRQTRPHTRRYGIGHLIPTNTSINRAKQDFDSLAELISTSIAPTSWQSVGGAGTIRQDHSTMMLVVSQQPAETHEQIADLLQQLSSLAKENASKRTISLQEEIQE
jgi:hypothetical protein